MIVPACAKDKLYRATGVTLGLRLASNFSIYAYLEVLFKCVLFLQMSSSSSETNLNAFVFIESTFIELRTSSTCSFELCVS